MPTQSERHDGKALTLGAVFLVDNAPECPEEMSWHDFSYWAIAEHLKRHSYYYHQKGNRKLATVSKMQSRILEICNYYAKPRMPKPDHKEFKDKVDVLFGYGRTKLLKKVFLDGLDYEKDTFPESRLNKHVSEGDGPAKAKTDGRPEGEEVAEVNGNDTSRNDIHVIVGQERCASEVAPPSRKSTLPSPSRHVSVPLQTSGNSRTGLKLKLGNNRDRHVQDGTARDEQPPPSRDERRPLRSSASIGPQSQTLSAGNGRLCASEEANAASSGSNSGGRNEPILGTKRKTTQDYGSQKRQCKADNATHHDDPSEHRPRLDAITQAERPCEQPSAVNRTKGPEAPQDSVANRKKQCQPQLARLNLDQQGRNMKSLYSDIQEATDFILSSIGTVRNTQSPLQFKPSCPLEDLYARCWGPQWNEVRLRQVDDHVFTTPQVTASLLSAFLYDKVLARGARLEELLSNVVEMGGSLGEALLEEIHISSRGEAIAKRARMIEAQKACSKLAQDHNTLQQQLELEAKTLAKDASTTLAPHLTALSSSAKHFGRSSDGSETDTLNVFESEFAKIIQKTLHYRLLLLATGCEYVFTWPSPDDIFSSGNMKVDGGRSENANGYPIVLFTVFPGLEIKPTSSNEMESLRDAKAVVKVQWR